MNEPIHIISLGAGVQSSTMALMAAAGEILPMPVAPVFADTQAEPDSVYRWLNWLHGQVPFPIYSVTKGDLTTAALVVKQRKDGTGFWSKSLIPAFIKNADGSRGITQRQCTHDYKILPLRRASLRLMKEHNAPSVVQWIGISLDEVHRMKPNRDPRIENRWPLVDARLNRHDCLRWMESKGYPKPPRSACVYCWTKHNQLHRAWCPGPPRMKFLESDAQVVTEASASPNDSASAPQTLVSDSILNGAKNKT